jgi:hypothetical protein
MLADVLGLANTLLALALLALGGYLLARRMLGEEARCDALALAIATLLAATAEALAIGLALGICGWLRIEWALAAQALLVAALGSSGLAAGAAADLRQAARRLGQRSWARLKAYPALSVLTLHAVGSEALRGLLRPPLSWDSLMYHLLLSATWLQQHDLAPVFGPYPINDYGYVPANGSIWFWWWMAPSHSELFVNLASLPHWALLGLAVGGIARQLGARRHWPLASFLVLLTPVVVRFAATEYVDIFVAATLLGGGFFALRWMARPRLTDAALAGAGCGLACGAKLLGVPYAAALAAAAILLAGDGAPDEPLRVSPENPPASSEEAPAPLLPASSRARAGRWPRERLPQLVAALLVAAALGSFFYLRNVALGAGPLALACEGREDVAAPGALPTPAVSPQVAPARTPMLPAIPRRHSVIDEWSSIGRRQLIDAFLGITRPQSVELGVGPQAFVLLLAAIALPFGVLAGRRRAALVAASQIGFELLFWLVVPFAANLHVFANVRYLVPAVGLAFAGAVAIAEQRGVSEPWLRGIGLALACQSLLQLHAEMPRSVRMTFAVVDLAAVGLGLSAGLRALARRRAAGLAAAALLLTLLGAPLLARFRAADRQRALASEWTAHASSAHLFAGGWGWLDAHGGTGAVAVVGAPATYFIYPAMGPFLQRRAVYVNVNRANDRDAIRYPACNPRVDPSPQAWSDNLAAARVRWLLLDRFPDFDLPVEARWAAARPDHFALRYADRASMVFEVLHR